MLQLFIPFADDGKHGNLLAFEQCSYVATTSDLPTLNEARLLVIVLLLLIPVIGLWRQQVLLLLCLGMALLFALQYLLFHYESYHFVVEHEVAIWGLTDSDNYIPYNALLFLPSLLLLLFGAMFLKHLSALKKSKAIDCV